MGLEFENEITQSGAYSFSLLKVSLRAKSSLL